MRFGRLKAIFGTLRVQLVIWITVVVTLMVMATMLVVREVVYRTLLYEFDQVLLGDSLEVSLMLKQIPSDQMIRALNRKAMGHAHQGWFVEIFDEEGTPIWTSDHIPQSLPEPELVKGKPVFQDVDAEENLYRMLLTHLVQENWWIRLGSSRQSLVEDVELLNRIMLLATLLIVLVTPVGAYALAGRATRPLAWIIATTARSQPEKLDERLPIRGSDDELDQLSSTINGMLDRIASYIARHRDFIANAAHELRSPLAAIRTTVEVALNRPRSQEEYQHLLTDVMVECSRLGTLVNRLLLLAEGDAGRLMGREQQVRLDKLVQEAVDMFRAVAESQEIDLRIPHLETVLVEGNEVHLRQVIRNLIDNAIKFNLPPGQVNIEVRHDPEKKQAYLVVSDTGIGIASENKERIFDRFYRGDKSRNRDDGPGGYGLGLSICQLIVRSLGGEILVKSQGGQGSTFTVVLPTVAETNLSRTALPGVFSEPRTK
jgi:signal transduction histidine kinase